MFRRILEFFRRDGGQDLAEYCLLMALIGLIALGIVLKVSGGIQGIWNAANAAMASGQGAGAGGPSH